MVVLTMAPRMHDLDRDLKILFAQYHQKRLLRAGMYMLFAIGGVLSLFTPNDIVVSQHSQWLDTVWSSAFVVVAVGCFIGAARDRWSWEYVLLPMQSILFALLGISLFVDMTVSNSILSLIYGCFFTAFSVNALARWREINAMLKAVREKVKK